MRAQITRGPARRRAARARASLGLLGLLVAGGCAGSHATRYEALHRDWQRSRSLPGPAVTDEDLFHGATVLDRAALVHHVLERNPTLRSARYAWRAALERYPQATALEDPMLGLGVAPRSFGSDMVDDAFKIDVSQKLPFPGKLALRGEAALAEAEAAGHGFAAVRLRLATMASLLFDDHYLAARARAINDEHITLLEEFKRIATARYEAGEAAQQDPIQAEVELTHALHRDVVLRTAQRVTAQQINALLHRRPDAPLPPPPAQLATPSGAPAPAALVDAALGQRPELRAAEAEVRARQAGVDLAFREFLPDFTLSAAYDRIWQESDLQTLVGLQINVPLQLARRRAALEEARARLEDARSQREALEDEVQLDVHSGADRLAEAQQVLRLFRDRLLPAARDQIEAARSGFETGRNSFLALIDAERNLLNVELGFEEALADASRRRAQLDRALGRVPGASR